MWWGRPRPSAASGAPLGALADLLAAPDPVAVVSRSPGGDALPLSANGKLERFWRTLDQEWAHSREWPASTIRDRALRSYLRFYNRRRPHSAAGGRPPITRVQHLREHDS